jgi:hypothetical protein
MNGSIDASLGFGAEFVNIDDRSEKSGNIRGDIVFPGLLKSQKSSFPKVAHPLASQNLHQSLPPFNLRIYPSIYTFGLYSTTLRTKGS